MAFIDLEKIHISSSKNHEVIVKSRLCGCFYCLSTFPPSAIKEWWDENVDNSEPQQTAVCPNCGIDSVIGDLAIPISMTLLKLLNQHFFDGHLSKQHPSIHIPINIKE